MSAETLGQAVRIVVGAAKQPETHEFIYDHLPIRIGRNPLNELQLDDRHVSQWHAVVLYLDGAIRVADVGSRNGTYVDGRSLTVGEAVPLLGSSRVEIRPFTLEVDPLDEPAAAKPQMLRAQGRQWVDHTRTYEAEHAESDSASTSLVTAWKADLLSQLRPLYLAYEGDWAFLCDRLREYLDQVGPQMRVALLRELQAELPAYRWDSAFPELRADEKTPAPSFDPEHPAMPALRDLAEHLMGRKHALASPAEVIAFLARVRDITDVFLHFTHSLLKGSRQIESSLAMPLFERESNPLHRVRDVGDLGARLLDFEADREGRAPPWLEAAFKSVLMQQIVMLSGMMNGVRTLLDELAPERVAEELKLGKKRVGPFRAQRLWQAYQARHRQLSQEDKATFERIFGPHLARAYDEIMGECYDSRGAGRPGTASQPGGATGPTRVVVGPKARASRGGRKPR